MHGDTNIKCPICNHDIGVAFAMIPGVPDRWECTKCAAWGDYATLSTEPVEAVRERLKRLTVSMGISAERACNS